MANLKSLDANRRLTPWIDKVHAGFVLGQYGSLLALSPERAKEYIQDYKDKEVEAKQAHVDQNEHRAAVQEAMGIAVSEPTEYEYIDWVPKIKIEKPKVEKKEEPKPVQPAEATSEATAEPVPVEAPKEEKPKKKTSPKGK